MRIQIYIGNKTQEDQLLRQVLDGLSTQDLKDLLLLGWRTRQEAAGNPTTNSPDAPNNSTTELDTQDQTPLSDGVVLDAYPPPSTQTIKEWEDDVAARRHAKEGQALRPISHLPPLLNQDPALPTAEELAQQAEAWRKFVETGELPPDTENA